MSFVSTKRVAGPAAAPVDVGDPDNGPLCFVQGALADADITQEAARLRALHAAQEREQGHDTRHLAGAGQSPRALLSLFRHAARTHGESNVPHP